MPVAVDTRSRRWAKQNPSKLLPVALYAAFSTSKPRSMPMNFLSCAKVFTISLQTFAHPHTEVGSAYFALLCWGEFGSMSVNPSSEEKLLGGSNNWRLLVPARPCLGSADFGLGSPAESVLSSVWSSASSTSLPSYLPSASSSSIPSASPLLLCSGWFDRGSVWLSPVLCKDDSGWCNSGRTVGHEKHKTEGAGKWELFTLPGEGPAARMGNTNGFSLPSDLAVAVDPAMPIAS